MDYDVIVIGKGPAGISAAIYLKRYGYNVLVIGKDGGALENVKIIENYYGIKQITGKELLQNGETQAKSLGIEILTEEVVNVAKTNIFKVTTTVDCYYATTVIIASGTARNRSSKFDKYENCSYCATCDAFFYRGKQVGILGSKEYMAHELQVLNKLCSSVVVFTDGRPLEADLSDCSNVKVDTSPIVDIRSEGRFLTGIKTEKEFYALEGCFIAVGQASGFTLAKHLGLALNNNSLVVNSNFMTNVSGLFACGDIIGGLLQVSKAVGDGANCATAVANYLKKNN